MPFGTHYHQKKVFITGHTGFKGSWLVQWLLNLGADVVGYALPPNTQPSLFQTLELAPHIRHIEGDIRNGEALRSAIQQAQPDIVFHMAAQALVRYGYQHPVETYETNAMGTVHTLEAIKHTPSVQAVVNVTSDKCYENREHIYGYREHDAMGGFDPYSNSKGVAELITSAYRSSYFNPAEWGKSHQVALASARAGNVIGGGDYSEDRLLPDCVQALNQGKAVHIRRPGSIRPWQFVLEPIAGYLHLGAKLLSEGATYAEGWNFGPCDESVLTVKDVVNQVIKAWGNGSIVCDEGEHPHEATLLTLDITKAQRVLGWHPIYTAPQAITHTIEWYKTFYQTPGTIKTFTQQQINDYTSAIRY